MTAHTTSPRLAVLPGSGAEQDRASAIALEVGAPVISRSAFEAGEVDAVLLVDALFLALAPSPLTMPNVSPVRIELREWEDLARRPVSLKQPLARAVGVASRAAAPSVLDASAGLLSDAFHLALLGCHVSACERSPLVHALAHDALLRASQSPALATIVSRITLRKTDAREVLASTPPGELPPVVFFDPMHPPRDRNVSALVRKDMRILRLVAGEDADAPDVARLALDRLRGPRCRLVLKLPLRAQPLPDLPAPAHVHEARTVRYEVHKPVHPADPANR